MAAAGTQVTAQKAADDAAVEEMRQQFGDQEAARLAADLYKLRRSSGGNLWGVMPRWVVFVAAIWLAALETASRLPELLLSYPKYQAEKADFQAKLLQPDLMAAQLSKAKFEAQAAAFQPKLTEMQLAKAKFEARAAVFQPDLTEAQTDKAKLEARAAVYLPDININNLTKLRYEARAAEWQPSLTVAQSFATQIQFLQGTPTSQLQVLGNMSINNARPLTPADFDAAARIAHEPQKQEP